MAEKQAVGKAIKFTNKQLEDLSVITDTDIEKVKQFWRDNASKKYKTLLDALPEGAPRGSTNNPNK